MTRRSRSHRGGRTTPRGGRTAPKGTRPGHLRPVTDASAESSPLDKIIDDGAREILSENDPIAPEMWASGLMNLFESARLQAQLAGQEVPSIGADLDALGRDRQLARS